MKYSESSLKILFVITNSLLLIISLAFLIFLILILDTRIINLIEILINFYYWLIPFYLYFLIYYTTSCIINPHCGFVSIILQPHYVLDWFKESQTTDF